MADCSAVDASVGPQVRELHIDFLLEEEFYSDPQFLRGFLDAAKFPDASANIVSVRRSFADAFGEADLIAVYSNSEGKRAAILIEDKLRAAFQPRQPERYAERGKGGMPKAWDAFWTCLVAPETYINRGHSFDAAVSLESLIELFAKNNALRHEFKSRVLKEAIQKCISSGPQVVDPVITEFRKQYFAYFEDFFRDELRDRSIRTSPPKPVWTGEIWIKIWSSLLPQGSYVHHKSDRGFVDLTFPDTNVATLNELTQFRDADLTPVQTGKSAAIRIRVLPIRNFNDFDEVQAKAKEAFIAVRCLLNFYVQEKAKFQEVLKRQAETAPR